MSITSLPSKYGIGTLGVEAYKFVDFLVRAKQREWQMLPIGPTSYGDSPYQALSTFAGNHYMIDLDMLAEEGLLKPEEINEINWGSNPEQVDYGILFKERMTLLRKALARFPVNDGYETFLRLNGKEWLDEYALFMALKEHFDYKDWKQWPEDLKNHKQAAIEKIKPEIENRIKFHYFLQYKFNQQWNKLRDYAKSKGITFIGDVPIYVPMDSVDVWANPENYQLNDKGEPTGVAGCPPDAFTADGQLWGNPLYDWEKMEKTGFKWWIKRLSITGKKFDTIRIDHFRGLESYYNVPYGDKTARNGKWVKGPGSAFIQALHQNLPFIDFIAEDLGYLTPEVKALLEESGYPGMKVLEFAFDPREPSNYLPHTYTENSVCYIGTHDNDPIMPWQEILPEGDRRFAEKYLGLPMNADLRYPLIRAGMASVSKLFVTQMQDWLALGKESRMNRPGIMDGKNWVWRILPGKTTDGLADEIAYMTQLYGRAN